MQLAYSVTSIACPQEGTLMLELYLIDNTGSLVPAPQLTSSTFSKYLTAGDKQLIPWLTAELQRPTKKNDAHQTRTLTVEASQLQSTLRLLATTGRLYFNNRRLVCDFFSRSSFVYNIDKSEGQWYVSGIIREGSEVINLHVCDAIRQQCYIRGGQLRFFAERPTWSHLRTLYTEKLILIDSTWKELLETYWQTSPADVHFESGSSAELWSPNDPLPLLRLTDRSGLFANLAMDYGGNKVFNYVRGAKATGKRQPATEKQWEDDLLTTDYGWKPTGTSFYYCPADKVHKSLTFLLELGWQIHDYQGNRIHLCTDTHLVIREEATHLVIDGKLHYGAHNADASKAIGCYNRRERFVTLSPGAVGLLPDSTAAGDISMLAAEGTLISEGIALPKHHFGLLSSINTQAATWQISPELKALLHGTIDGDLIDSATISSAFCGQLRPYQQAGVDWLQFLHNTHMHGLLADDMGLGKTVQVLAFLSTLQTNFPHLIVVPTSLLHNWHAEIQRFLPQYKTCIHHGPQRPKNSSEWYEANIILTSYSVLRLDASLFQTTNFHCLILDEAHVIKNAATQAAQAACNVPAQFRLSMTGTPVENNLKELWSQFNFLIPGLLGKQDEFSNDVASSQLDPRFLQRIKRYVKPFILRRTKAQVAPELPPKIEQTVWVEMGAEQRQLYEAFLSGARQNLLQKVTLDGAKKHHFEILEVLLRLRQICCHPLLVMAQNAEAATVNSAKFDLLVEDLDNLAAEGAKVLVYSQFTSLLKLVAKQLQERNYRYCYLDGQTQDRAQAVASFQQDAEIPFFLISLKAGGVGLNLTAADYVLLLDPWWNEAAEQQAIDRAHRIGRDAPVIAKRYVMVGTIEEKIMQLKVQKQSLAQEIMGEETGALDLTAQDFAWLLNDE